MGDFPYNIDLSELGGSADSHAVPPPLGTQPLEAGRAQNYVFDLLATVADDQSRVADLRQFFCTEQDVKTKEAFSRFARFFKMKKAHIMEPYEKFFKLPDRQSWGFTRTSLEDLFEQHLEGPVMICNSPVTIKPAASRRPGPTGASQDQRKELSQKLYSYTVEKAKNKCVQIIDFLSQYCLDGSTIKQSIGVLTENGYLIVSCPRCRDTSVRVKESVSPYIRHIKEVHCDKKRDVSGSKRAGGDESSSSSPLKQQKLVLVSTPSPALPPPPYEIPSASDSSLASTEVASAVIICTKERKDREERRKDR